MSVQRGRIVVVRWSQIRAVQWKKGRLYDRECRSYGGNLAQQSGRTVGGAGRTVCDASGTVGDAGCTVREGVLNEGCRRVMGNAYRAR